MKPYIETATETAALEMEKWNKNEYRSRIINLLDDVDEAFFEIAREIADVFRKRRIEKNLTREQVAEQSGVAVSNIVRF